MRHQLTDILAAVFLVGCAATFIAVFLWLGKVQPFPFHLKLPQFIGRYNSPEERSDPAQHVGASGVVAQPIHNPAAQKRTTHNGQLHVRFPEEVRGAGSPVVARSGAGRTSELDREDAATKHLQLAELLFENTQYPEALSQCNLTLVQDPSNTKAVELKRKIERAIELLKL